MPPSSATYTVNADCTGTVHFLDPSNVTPSIDAEASGDTIRMLQTNPSNDVFEGTTRLVNTLNKSSQQSRH